MIKKTKNKDVAM